MLLLVCCEGGHAQVPGVASSSAPALLCRSGAVVQLLLCEEGKSLRHKGLVILEYHTVTRIGINEQLTVGQALEVGSVQRHALDGFRTSVLVAPAPVRPNALRHAGAESSPAPCDRSR